jgi:DNA polymerase-1
MVDNKGWNKVWWFDHESTEYEPTDTRQNMKEIQDEFNKADLVVAHNLKHDASILLSYDVLVPDTRSHCTMLTEFLLAGQSRRRKYSLDAVCLHYNLSSKLDAVKSYWDRGIETYAIPKKLIHEYVLDDCTKTLNICELQLPLVAEYDMEKLVDLQNEFTHVLVDMETNGFAFDMDRAMEIHKEYHGIMLGIQESVRSLVRLPKLNLDSTSQLAALLFGGELKFKWTEPATYANGREYNKHFKEVVDRKAIWVRKDRSTTRAILKTLPCKTKIQRELKELLVRYSEVKKVANTLLNKTGDKGLTTKVQTDGRIHPSLNQTIARTGRLTSSDPNGQNLPRDGTSPIKETIIPTLDCILQWDLSQIEWRAAAFVSQDPTMIAEIVADVDQHINACINWMELPFVSKSDPESYKNRTNAKIFNFRMIYKGTAYGFYMDVKMPDFPLPKWERIESMFYDHYDRLDAWGQGNITKCLRDGYYILPTGKRFVFFKDKEVRGALEYNTRQMVNYPIQGISGDVLYLAAVIIRRGMKKKGCKSKMILTVHDSLVFDAAHNEVEWLCKLCTKVTNNLPNYIQNYFGFEWNVPLDGECEVGPNYGALKEVDYKWYIERSKGGF